MPFIPQQCYRKQKVIIPLHRLSLRFHCATSSQSTGRHVAVQIAGKDVIEVRGIGYDTYGGDQKQEGGEPPYHCCGLPILTSDREESLDGNDFPCLSSVITDSHTPFQRVSGGNRAPPEEPLQTKTRDHINIRLKSPKRGLEPRTVFL